MRSTTQYVLLFFGRGKFRKMSTMFFYSTQDKNFFLFWRSVLRQYTVQCTVHVLARFLSHPRATWWREIGWSAIVSLINTGLCEQL